MKKSLVVSTLVGMVLFTVQTASATPFLDVTADHLGGGYVQYTLSIDNDLGGNVSVQLTVTGGPGQINQVASIIFGDIDLLSDAVAIEAQGTLDALYFAGGGKAYDSWWDDANFSIPALPFSGAQGGTVGSNQYQFSGVTTGLSAPGTPNVSLLGQIVIFDPLLAATPAGSLQVVATGNAQFNIIDPEVLADDLDDSLFAVQGVGYPLAGSSFAVVPEPATMSLLALGGIALLRRRRNRG